jgi:hypothetical protein
MPDDSPKLREIRAKLDAIAPLPAGETVTARDLGRHFAVRAQERWTRGLEPWGPGLDPAQISAMCAEFAAAHALYALAEADGNIVPEDEAGSAFTAAQIRDAIEDGEIGPRLYEHLGGEMSNAVARLAGELVAAMAATAVPGA